MMTNLPTPHRYPDGHSERVTLGPAPARNLAARDAEVVRSPGKPERPQDAGARRPLLAWLAAAILALLPAAAAEAQGTAFTYQGRLTDNGTPAEGVYDVRFVLYDAPVGGAQVGPILAPEDVAVTSGLFTVSLDFGASAFTGGARWLEIGVRPGASVGAYTTLGSRQELTPSPHAVFSEVAANANAAPWSGLTGVPPTFPPSPHAHSGADVTSGTLGDARLSANVAVLGSAQTFTAAKGFSVAPSFTAAGAPFTVTSQTKVSNLNADLLDGLNSTQFASSSPPLTLTGTEALHIIKGSNAATNVFASALIGESTATTGTTFGVLGENLSPDGTGVFGQHAATSGTAPGVYGQSDSTVGRGVYGRASANTGQTYGVRGESDSTGGRGVLGGAYATTGTTFGVSGESFSTAGRGVYGLASANTGQTYGVRGESDSTGGRGVLGGAYATTGTTFGVSGESFSTAGRGVYGLASASTGFTYGVRGETDSTAGRGVYGYASATTGTTYGVRGWSDSTAGRGVYGYAPDTGAAGWFDGRVNVMGTLFKAGGAFRIDHPLDPENKYLYHSFVESPDMMNIYNGIARTDESGYATVELPAWFEALNRDFRYQLTVIDETDAAGFVLAKVVQEVQANRFRLRTSIGNVKVSWQVTGIRQDRFAEKHRIPIEEDKSDAERGRYLHPVEHGQPEEKGVDYEEKRRPRELLRPEEESRVRPEKEVPR